MSAAAEVSAAARATGALGVDRVGSGPPLVLLHPLGAWRGVWAPVIDRLAGEFELIAFDLPGFGESAPLPAEPPPTPARLAQAVADELERLGVRDYAVAGNSLGAWIAFELALAGHARAVTAIAPAGLWSRPLRPKAGVGRQIARGLLPALPLLVRTPLRRLLLATVASHPQRIPNDAAVALVRSYATAPGFAAVNAAMRANHFTELARLTVPLTIGWPDRDLVVGRPAHAVPPSARQVELRGCGHVPMWDEPDAVAALLRDGSA